MIVEITEETAAEVTKTTLEEAYNIFLEALEDLLKGGEVQAMKSFHMDEEIFHLVDMLKSLLIALTYYGGSVRDFRDLIQEYNKEMYLDIDKFEDMKLEKENWHAQALTYLDELNELKEKIGSLV